MRPKLIVLKQKELQLHLRAEAGFKGLGEYRLSHSVSLPYICDREQRGEVYKTQYM